MKYKINKVPVREMPFGEPNIVKNDESLTGWVNGKKASDIEERFARALSSNERVDGFVFIFPVVSPQNMVGQLELDFLIQAGAFYYPVQIDGTYAHKNASKQSEDMVKDRIIWEHLKASYSVMPVVRIKGIALETQEEANLQVEMLIR